MSNITVDVLIEAALNHSELLKMVITGLEERGYSVVRREPAHSAPVVPNPLAQVGEYLSTHNSSDGYEIIELAHSPDETPWYLYTSWYQAG